MSVNKVQLANGETIIDISDSTVTPENLAEGVTAHDASGQKITGKMVPGGGSSVQSDWNQTDESAADFIKNKPFGDEVVEILPETEVIGKDVGDGLYAASIESESISGTEEMLIVTFDGDKYTCYPVGHDFGVTLFGNLGLAGMNDTGEPFLVDLLGAMLGAPNIIFASGEPHTVGIESVSIEKLDAKYVTSYASFYVSLDFADDPYIYTDIALSNKATISDLLDAKTTQVVQLHASGGAISKITLSPLIVDCLSGYIEFRNWKGVGNEYIRIYTAEYTPPTT